MGLPGAPGNQILGGNTMPYDFKKEQKALYAPKAQPGIVAVPLCSSSP